MPGRSTSAGSGGASSSRPGPPTEALVRGGVCGFKVHEDTGAHVRALDTALRVADEHDVQAAIHTDGLNESLSVADTVRVIGGRSVHPSRSAAAGTRPTCCRWPTCRTSSLPAPTPTLPYGRDAVAERLAMITAVHGLKPGPPGPGGQHRHARLPPRSRLHHHRRLGPAARKGNP
jgi:urease subunit alpha